VSYDQEKYSKA